MNSELNAVNVKLDEVLNNQIRISISAISEVSQDIQIVIREIGRLPASTLALDRYIAAQRVTKSLADAFFHRDASRVVEAVNLGYQVSVDLEFASKLPGPEPDLALACRCLLVSAQALATHQKFLNREAIQKLSDTIVHFRSALDILVTPSGILSRIPEMDQALQRSVAALNNAKLKLLPMNFSDATAASQLASPASKNVCASSAPGPLTEIRREGVYDERGKCDHQGFCGPPRKIGTEIYAYSLRDLSTYRYQIVREMAFENIPYYIVILDKDSKPSIVRWRQDVVDFRGIHDEQQGIYEIRSDSPQALAACPPLSLGESGNDWIDFQQRLATYNSAVVLKSRLIVVQEQAKLDLEACRILQKKL